MSSSYHYILVILTLYISWFCSILHTPLPSHLALPGDVTLHIVGALIYHVAVSSRYHIRYHVMVSLRYFAIIVAVFQRYLACRDVLKFLPSVVLSWRLHHPLHH